MDLDTPALGHDRKRQNSKAAYAKSKSEREHALLRLRPGSLARLDQARAPLGLSRSAYFEALLDLTLDQAASGPAPSIGDQFEALFGRDS